MSKKSKTKPDRKDAELRHMKAVSKKIIEHGKQIIKFGESLTNPKTTLSDIVTKAEKLGINVRIDVEDTSSTD